MAEEKDEDWMQKKWRPAMGWMYMAVCACDFMLFPILWSLHQAINHGQVSSQWQPLTLQGAGLFHLAMGAVLGIAAYGRTQEKLAGTAVNPTATTPIGAGGSTSNFGGAGNGGFGSNGGTAAFSVPQAGGFAGSGGNSPAANPFSSPTPTAAGNFGSSGFGLPSTGSSNAAKVILDPSDPQTRNTRNDL